MPSSYNQRTSGAELPSAAELIDILRAESPRRSARTDFLDKNQHLFAVYREISLLAGSDDGWIDSYSELSLEDLAAAVVKNHQQLRGYIESHTGETELYERLYKSLVPTFDESPSEAIFVFGAPSNARVELAVQLYKKGVAPRIIVSGKGPYYGPDDAQPEAERMAAYAIEKGVPREALIIEAQSITLPDNVKRTIDLLEVKSWYPKSVTVIATDLFLSRAMMEWYRFADWNPIIKASAPMSLSSMFTPSGWYKEPDGIGYVLIEFAKLVFETKLETMRT